MSGLPKSTKADLKQIPLSRLPQREEGLSFSFPPEPGPILGSMAAVGLLHPPHVTEDLDGKVAVVTGNRRIAAARKLEWESIPCLVHPRENLSERDAFEMDLSETLSWRALNEVEKAFVLNHLTNHFHVEKKETIAHTMPLLDLPSRGPVLEKYLSLCSLEEPVLREIANGTFHVRSAFALLRFPSQSSKEVFRFISPLQPSTNTWCELLTTLFEISMRDRRPPGKILEDSEEIQRIHASAKLTASQKREGIRILLRNLRNPEYTIMETKCSLALANLKCPEGIRVKLSPSFEEMKVAFSFSLRAPEDGEKVLHQLSNLLLKKRLQPLFDALRGD